MAKVVNYQDNYCVDTPSPKDYPAQEYIEMALGAGDPVNFPYKEEIVWDQWQTGACSRFGITHGNNGQNILEWIRNWLTYAQLNPMDVWNRSDKSIALLSALGQFKTEWLIVGYTAVPRIPSDKSAALMTMKQALDLGQFIYTGSDNGNWVLTGTKPYIYTLRTDWRIVGHCWCIVGYDNATQLFKVINSRWPTWGDKGYFYLRFEDIDKIFTKYCLIDKDDSQIFARFKRQQKAKQLADDCHTFREWETDQTTQDYLHNLAQKLRSEYMIK